MFKNKLKIEHICLKNNAATTIRPEKGWINAVRTTLNMSLSSLGEKLNTTPEGIKKLENREENGSITLNALKEAAEDVY